ncbi:unnamed protein product [Hymenolepis diminuta]|uniref:Uncharacterized protein n=1 Tax=Hymenolepis diminuta TaxID=6216 RepID=A0A564Y9M0_HYMDI|nr:unnamed protein product [Hymenolepis diminuta]
MTQNPYLSCPNASIGFPTFYSSLVPLKSTSALMFSLILTQVTHIKPSLFSQSKQLARVSYRLLRLLSFLTRLNPHCGLINTI